MTAKTATRERRYVTRLLRGDDLGDGRGEQHEAQQQRNLVAAERKRRGDD